MSGQYHPAVPGHIFNTQPLPVLPGQPAPKVTRNRQPVSCAACRKSKLKCDREKPCEACIRRGYRDQCFYEGAKIASRKKRRTVGSQNAQERLKNLETLVMQAAQPLAPSEATPASSVGSVGQSGLHESHTPSEGHITVQGNASTYAGSTHWSTILGHIQELKTAIVSEDGSEDGHTDQKDPFDPDTLSLFCAPRSASMDKILEALPSRTQLDRYLSTYFKASYLVLPILHKGRFQREYEDFWRDPLHAPPLWTSILFSILTIASAVSLINEYTNMEEEQARREEFVGAAAQCLVFGNYWKPQGYVMEAMILFGQSKYVASIDPTRETALISVLVFRFAFEMGYHRDPEHFSHLTVFEGEMRRRVWALCRQVDLLQAYQAGLPTYIPHDSYDTKPFSNLADSDFDEQSTCLPPPRPEVEPTRILQFSVKCRLIISFSPAFRSAISLKPIPIETVMQLDKDVREAHSRVPPSLQIKSIGSSFADSSSVVMARVDIELLFRRTLCTLHRKHMTAGNTYSREVCRVSALSILNCLVDLRREMQPGHMLAGDQWLMSCYAMHDFVFAAMLLCLVVSQRRKGNANHDVLRESQDEIEMIREAWKTTYALSGTSREAKRVATVLGRMLTSLEGNLQVSHTASTQHSTAQLTKHDQDVAAPVAFPAGPPGEPQFQFTFEQDPFENLNAIPEDIDWACLDQYYLNMNMNMNMNVNMNPEMGLNSANMFMYNATGAGAVDAAGLPIR